MIRPWFKVVSAAATAFLAALAVSAAPAAAQDNNFLNRITLTVTPTYTVVTGSDAFAGHYQNMSAANPGGTLINGAAANGNPFCFTNSAGCYAAGLTPTNDLQWNYDADISLTRGLSIFYSHDMLNYTLGGFIVPTAPGGPGALILTGDQLERTDTEGLSFTGLAKGFTLQAGYYNRSVVCCPADAQNATGGHNSHGPFVAIKQTFGPRTFLGPIFNVSARAQWATGRTIAAEEYANGGAPPAAPPTLYQGNTVYYPLSAGATFPIGTVHRFVVGFVQWANGAEDNMNEIGPDYEQVVAVGIAKPINKYLLYHAAFVNIHENNVFGVNGNPLPNAGATDNIVRISEVTMGLDIKLHL